MPAHGPGRRGLGLGGGGGCELNAHTWGQLRISIITISLKLLCVTNKQSYELNILLYYVGHFETSHTEELYFLNLFY